MGWFLAVGFQRILEFHYDRLNGFLSAVSFRLRLLRFLKILFTLASGFLLVLLGNLATPHVGEVFPYAAFVLNLLAAIFFLFLTGLALWRWAGPISLEQVARKVEERFPHLNDDLTNSILLYRQTQQDLQANAGSRGFISAQIRKAAAEVYPLCPGQVVRLSEGIRSGTLLIPLLLASGLAFLWDPQALKHSFFSLLHPFSTLPVEEISIEVQPKGSVVLRGSPFRIAAEVTGKVPDRLSLFLWPEGRPEVRVSMQPEGNGRFIYRIPQVQKSFRYQAYSDRAVSPLYRLEVVDPPEVGQLKLVLTPPNYSGLPREVQGLGHIEALKGTWVALEAKATKRLKEGKMIFNQGSSLPLEISGDRLKGGFLVFDPGGYSIQVKDELGFENPSPVAYSIQLVPDRHPEAQVLNPVEDLEVVGNEILPVVYTVKDDFGLTAVKLNYQIGGKENWIFLKNLSGERSVPPTLFRWDLGSLPLTAGDKVIFRLGVWDNDAVSGPKVGYSRSFSLTVRDEGARAVQEGEEARRIADALLHLLADHLEEIADKKTLARKMGKILNQLTRKLDPMEAKADRLQYDALRRNLASLKERIFEESRETVTQEMERLALLAEEIAKRAKMEEVAALARELRNRHRRLIDSLNEIKGPLTKEGLEEILKELKKLEELLLSVLGALGQMATDLPEEFINSPELRDFNPQEVFKDLNQVREKLMAGDLAGALEAAQRMLQALSEMMAALTRAHSQAQRSRMDRLQGEMRQQAGELDRLSAEQKEILRETEAIDQEVRKKREEETRRRLRQSLGPLKEALEEIERLLSLEQKGSAQAMQELLREGQMEKLLDFTRDLEKEFSTRPEKRPLLEGLKEMIDGLFPDAQETLDPGPKGKFPALSSRQEALKERTARLQEKLEKFAQLFPGMDIEILKDLKEAALSMGKAAGRLSQEDAPGAIPPEEEALRRLTRSQQALQQMAQQMAQQMQIARWGQPLFYDPRPGWYYGPWAPMPTLPQPEVKRPIERGYTGIDREEFEPPGKEAYRVPQILREKITEALKEDIPSSYKKEVERYFRGLTE